MHCAASNCSSEIVIALAKTHTRNGRWCKAEPAGSRVQFEFRSAQLLLIPTGGGVLERRKTRCDLRDAETRGVQRLVERNED
jgi:hypothetical protein